MVAISDGRPKLMGLREIIDSYLNHQIEVVANRTKYDLNHAEKRMHIVEGLMKALSILDEVIALIRHSKNKKDAKDNLVKEFDFTEAQAEAIVMLQLYRLTNTDIVALEEEHEELQKLIEEYRNILDNHDALLNVIKKSLQRFENVLKHHVYLQLKRKYQKLKLIKKLLYQVKKLF